MKKNIRKKSKKKNNVEKKSLIKDNVLRKLTNKKDKKKEYINIELIYII